MSATLRVLRIQTGLTLEELANLTDLTRSYLSKVERGLATPSITSALRIARALDVSIESLFDADPASDPVAIVRNPLTSEKPRTGVLELVAGAYSKWQMLAFVIHPDDTKSSTNLAGNHEGEEIVYVLSGKIELQLVNRKEVLGVGDCAHFDSTVPHRISSLSGPDARVLIVVSPRKKPTRKSTRKPVETI